MALRDLPPRLPHVVQTLAFLLFMSRLLQYVLLNLGRRHCGQMFVTARTPILGEIARKGTINSGMCYPRNRWNRRTPHSLYITPLGSDADLCVGMHIMHEFIVETLSQPTCVYPRNPRSSKMIDRRGVCLLPLDVTLQSIFERVLTPPFSNASPTAPPD